MPPPTILVTKELSKVQLMLITYTREMTRALDDIGTRHTERLFNQEKMFMERLLETHMRTEQRLDGARKQHASSAGSLMLSWRIRWMI